MPIKDTDTLHALFEAQVRQNPNHIAVMFQGESITYGELNIKANQLALYLREKGVSTESKVALCIDRSINLLIALLAILKAGGAYVPLDPTQHETRLFALLTDINNPLIIITADLKSQFIHYQGQILVLDEEEKDIRQQPNNNPTHFAKSHHLAYIIYTSGSTGTPKGVLIEHRSVIHYGLWFEKYSQCHRGQRIDFSSNFIFDMAVTTTIVALMLGLTIVICSDTIKKQTRDYFEYLNQNKINIIKLTPSYFKILLYEINHRFIPLPHLKILILGGENLTTIDCASWLKRYPKHQLFNEYGPTEATVAISSYKVCKNNIHTLSLNVPIGEACPNIHCHILDTQLHPIKEGEIGELYVGGICLARGYLNHPELTTKAFIQNPFSHQKHDRLYKTGDLCRRTTDGVLDYIGRIDNQIKIRGYRIEPSEIERHLVSHPDIHDAVVLSQEDPFHEKRLVAYYILKTNAINNGLGDIRQFLKMHLPAYMIPTLFVRVETFPLTENGKLDHSALPVPQFITSSHYQAPETKLEKQLADIWSEALGIKPIGLTDDFFELGGHSLSAARIISKINFIFKKDIKLHEFYSYPTIAKLVSVINHAASMTMSTTQSYNAVKSIPLSDFQFILWISNTFEPKAKKLNITARKRLQGQPNIDALSFAFKEVFKKHEILSYQILKFRPLQRLQQNKPFSIIEHHLEDLSTNESEQLLQSSIQSLMNYYPWHTDTPLLISKLFYLQESTSELQICLPHIISDDISPEILLNDLSHFYLNYIHSTMSHYPSDQHYKDYIFNEQQYLQTYLDRDILFWENYLNDAKLFTFPPKYVVKDKQLRSFSYSTYADIPEEGLNQLQIFCAQHRVGILDGLCAVLTLALYHCCGDDKDNRQPILINIIRTARTDQQYDQAIGCFLRVEPIKVDLTHPISFSDLSKQIHQATIESNPYQQCSSLVKLGCINPLRFKKKNLKQVLLSMFSYLYMTFLKAPPFFRTIFNFIGRLSAFERQNDYFTHLNVNHHFIKSNHQDNIMELLGFKTKPTPIEHTDLLSIESIFEVFFMRNDDNNSPYLVISANLTPEFRKQIANEIIRIMTCETKTDL